MSLICNRIREAMAPGSAAELISEATLSDSPQTETLSLEPEASADEMPFESPVSCKNGVSFLSAIPSEFKPKRFLLQVSQDQLTILQTLANVADLQAPLRVCLHQTVKLFLLHILPESLVVQQIISPVDGCGVGERDSAGSRGERSADGEEPPRAARSPHTGDRSADPEASQMHQQRHHRAENSARPQRVSIVCVVE